MEFYLIMLPSRSNSFRSFCFWSIARKSLILELQELLRPDEDVGRKGVWHPSDELAALVGLLLRSGSAEKLKKLKTNRKIRTDCRVILKVCFPPLGFHKKVISQKNTNSIYIPTFFPARGVTDPWICLLHVSQLLDISFSNSITLVSFLTTVMLGGFYAILITCFFFNCTIWIPFWE